MAERDIDHIKGMVSAQRFVIESFLQILEKNPEKFRRIAAPTFQEFKEAAAAYNHFLIMMTPNLAGSFYLRSGSDSVGPFDTAEEANDWMDEFGQDDEFELEFVNND